MTIQLEVSLSDDWGETEQDTYDIIEYILLNNIRDEKLTIKQGTQITGGLE